MAKKIYCLIGSRCKIITFDSIESISDREIISEKIKQIYIDCDIWCDIEEHEVINDKEKINIIFEPNISVSHASSIPLDVNLQNESIKVLYTEPCLDLLDDLTKENSNDKFKVIQIDEIHQPSASVLKPPADVLANNNNANTDSNTDVEIKNDSQVSELDCVNKNVAASSNLLPPRQGPGTVTSLIQLPELTADLKKLLETRTPLQLQKKLVAFWGAYLLRVTDGTPTRNDYKNFGNAIIKNFNSLADQDGGSLLVRNHLSTWIRNQRQSIKRECSEVPNAKPLKKCRSKAMITSDSKQRDNKSPEPEINIDRAIKELEEGKINTTKNIIHVKKLLKITLAERRKWIESDEVTSVTDIITKYPQLLDDNLILYEFCNLENIDSEYILFENIKNMITELMSYYGIKDKTEVAQAKAITSLCESLKNKKIKNFRPLFIIKEVRSSTEDLESTDGESVRAVIYTEKAAFATAWLVADGDIKIKVSDPSMVKVVACLLGAHYVWDSTFPSAYKNILSFFDHKILKKSISKNQVVQKFLKTISSETSSDEDEDEKKN